MSRDDREMERALVADGAKLRQLTGEDHGPWPLRGLTVGEMKAQAARCPCGGSDDYCPCQNVPDAVTRREWGLPENPIHPARRSLAVLAHNLRRIGELLSKAASEPSKGEYVVPWSTLGWSRDTVNLGAETLEEITGPVCRDCDGLGYVANPDARYWTDNDTGYQTTNDPEEIDCPTCGGCGFPDKPTPAAVLVRTGWTIPQSPPAIDDDMPF